jgi:AraC-like DNA-binding protein
MARARSDLEQTRIVKVWRQPPNRQPDADERALGLWIDRIGTHADQGTWLPGLRIIGLHALCAVVSGRGRLQFGDGRSCELATGDAWWLLPLDAANYGALPGTRWSHVSIVFGGPLADALAARLRPAEALLSGRAAAVRQAWSGLAALHGAAGAAAAAQRLAAVAALAGMLAEGGAAPDQRLGAALVQLADHGPGALDSAMLARRVGLSPSQLRRLFARHCGCSPVEWLMRCRLQRAAELLAQTALPVQAVAAEAGFDDPFWFSRLFRRELGVSPRTWRNQRSRSRP